MSAKAPFETHHHVVPIFVYVKVITALIVLMIITVVVGQIQIPSWWIFSGTLLNQMFALLIAVIKATLVVLFFMGVRWSTNLTKLWAMLGFVWLSFFTIMWGDYGTRSIENVQGWEPRESALERNYKDHIWTAPPNEINVKPRTLH
jgi:cytochrome c oxidase subunit 4